MTSADKLRIADRAWKRWATRLLDASISDAVTDHEYRTTLRYVQELRALVLTLRREAING